MVFPYSCKFASNRYYEVDSATLVQNSRCVRHGDDKGDEQTEANPCILKRMDGHLPLPPYNPLQHHTHTHTTYKGMDVEDE